MRWFEKLVKSRILYKSEDAITEHPGTFSISAALDDEYGDRVMIETVPGSYDTVEAYNEAWDVEVEKLAGGLYNIIVLPFKEAERFRETLNELVDTVKAESIVS